MVDGETVPWNALKEAFKQNSRFVKLGSGAYARLPEDWLARQVQLGQSLGFQAEGDGDHFIQKLPRYLAPAARELMESASEASADIDWRGFLQGLEAVEGVSEVPTPVGFVGELRHYQERGLAR